MHLIKRYILYVLLIVCSVNKITAQQQSTSLPSLVESQHNTDATPDEATLAYLKQKMFVKVFTNKNRIYVGEPVLATYKFYVTLQISDQPSVTRQPEFSGCSVQEINFNQGPEFETINKEQYAVYTIRKVQLTPLQPGKLSLGRAYVNNFIQVENANSIIPRKYNIELCNTDMSVDVEALPESNKPKNFNGITGNFSITASVDNNTIPVGENGQLNITINGSGNLDAINLPVIEWPAGIEHFDGTDSQHINQNSFPINGDKIFEIPYVGKNEGIVIIPPIQFIYFNTDTKKYETIATTEIPLTFTKALSKKDIIAQFDHNNNVSNYKYLWIVAAIALLVACIGIITYKKSKKNVVKKKVAATPAVPVMSSVPPVYKLKLRTDFSRLLEHLKPINDHKQFFAKAKEILIIAVAERVDLDQNSEEVLLNALQQRTYNAPVCKRVETLFDAINMHLYAPYETNADFNYFYDELKNLVEILQSET
ncbi:MAG: BatD family protein [Bacteroidetes bacterium]|nr:BatD family protein [Bacteroidota bacterium]